MKKIILVEKLYCLAKQKISDHGICAREARFGFHWPPFNSISHLHLHAIAPAKEMTLFGHIIFLPNTPWFVTVCIIIIFLLINTFQIIIQFCSSRNMF